MCRNITELRGLQPPATDEEIVAAARQYVRKVSGLSKVPVGVEDVFENAVARGRGVDPHAPRQRCLARRQPPPTVPPLRRPEVRARIEARAAQSADERRPARHGVGPASDLLGDHGHRPAAST